MCTCIYISYVGCGLAAAQAGYHGGGRTWGCTSPLDSVSVRVARCRHPNFQGFGFDIVLSQQYYIKKILLLRDMTKAGFEILLNIVRVVLLLYIHNEHINRGNYLKSTCCMLYWTMWCEYFYYLIVILHTDNFFIFSRIQAF